MSRPISITDSLTAHPSGVLDDHAYDSISNQANAYNESSNTSYATINLVTGSGAITYIYYTFDFSDIPAGATIDSVSCSAKAYISTTNSSRITTRQIQLFSGSTAKGSAYTVSNSTSAFTMTPGTWTREELQNARIRLYAVRGTSNTTSTYYFRLYPQNEYGVFNKNEGQEVSCTPKDIIASIVEISAIQESDGSISFKWSGDNTVGSVRVVYKAETEEGVHQYRHQ